MGVRPPSSDVDDDPSTVEFGIAALDARVGDRNVSFPVSKGDLEAAHGDIRVAVDPGGTKITLQDALAACDQERFESKQDLLNALYPVFEQKRERLSGGLFGRLRSMLPF